MSYKLMSIAVRLVKEVIHAVKETPRRTGIREYADSEQHQQVATERGKSTHRPRVRPRKKDRMPPSRYILLAVAMTRELPLSALGPEVLDIVRVFRVSIQ